VKIPYVYVSFCDADERKGRWDQAWVQRLLDQTEWKVPGGVEFFEYDTEPGDPAGPMEGCVIIFPCGHYAEHCSPWLALARLQRLVDSLPWSLVIATSDEASTFPWARFHRPDNCRLWVMTPRPEKKYPEGTFFIGEGCPWPPEEIASHALPDWDKPLDLFFSGQINHDRRIEMIVAVEEVAKTHRVERHATEGFRQGMSVGDYLKTTTHSKIIPCPSGRSTQDSFRFYEALEAQAIPIADERRPKTKHPGGYWEMIFGDSFPFGITRWQELPEKMRRFRNAPETPAMTSAWWQQYKRSIAYELDDTVKDLVPTSKDETASDQITAVVVTSPSPLHPSIDMIMETIHSVRNRLPDAEILIGVDGLRPDDGRVSYYEYARRLCAAVNPMRNVCPVVYGEHLHQSGMMSHLIGEVETKYILFMEHDTPLHGVIDFDECLMLMGHSHLDYLRFHYDDSIAPEHAPMFLETTPGKKKFIRTIQYSARPHLVRTDTLEWWLATYFGKSKTFLEDTLHSVLAHPTEAEYNMDRLARNLSIWQRNRLAVYTPTKNFQRSYHLDGRRGADKRPTWIEYDGATPPGCPLPGVLKV
jgi:hypothetical protein